MPDAGKAPKGRNIPARGNAPGYYTGSSALKGRDMEAVNLAHDKYSEQRAGNMYMIGGSANA